MLFVLPSLVVLYEEVRKRISADESHPNMVFDSSSGFRKNNFAWRSTGLILRGSCLVEFGQFFVPMLACVLLPCIISEDRAEDRAGQAKPHTLSSPKNRLCEAGRWQATRSFCQGCPAAGASIGSSMTRCIVDRFTPSLRVVLL